MLRSARASRGRGTAEEPGAAAPSCPGTRRAGDSRGDGRGQPARRTPRGAPTPRPTPLTPANAAQGENHRVQGCFWPSGWDPLRGVWLERSSPSPGLGQPPAKTNKNVEFAPSLTRSGRCLHQAPLAAHHTPPRAPQQRSRPPALAEAVWGASLQRRDNNRQTKRPSNTCNA